MSGIPDAPWVGCCREDYEDKMHGKRSEDEFVCNCENCGRELYDDDEIHEIGDIRICGCCYWADRDKWEKDDESCPF